MQITVGTDVKFCMFRVDARLRYACLGLRKPVAVTS